VATSNDESKALGNFGVIEGTPLLMINSPSLVKNNLSILGR